VAVSIITQRDTTAALSALPPSHAGSSHTHTLQEDASALALPRLHSLEHAAAAASASASSPPPSAAPSAADTAYEGKLASRPSLQPPVLPLPQSLHGSLAAVSEAPLLGFPLDVQSTSTPSELQVGGSTIGSHHHPSKQGSSSNGQGGGFRSWLFGAAPQPEASNMSASNAAGQSSSSRSRRHGARSVNQRQQRVYANPANPLGGEGEAAACFPYPPDLLQQHPEATVVTEQLVEVVLGPAPFGGSEAHDRVQAPGAATGLVWTSTGGSVQYIECVRTSVGQRDRPGTLTLTGQVGEVLEESAQIALSWIRAHAYELQLDAPCSSSQTPRELAPTPAQVRSAGGNAGGDVSAVNDALTSPRAHGQHLLGPLHSDPDVASKHSARIELLNPASCWDLHLHLPAGAIPKDGPSTGITIAVTLISVLTGRCVRSDTAMTGELTLRGLVLPVGGLKEKLLAARRAGLSRAIVPARNMPEIIAEVSPAVRASLQIVPVQRLEEALEAAFDPPFYLLPRPRM